MSERVYDVVIVGAGIAGAILAKTLTSAGAHVLLLEAGSATETLDLEPAEAQRVYEGYLQTFYNAVAKVPNSPYPNLPVAMSPNVLDIPSANALNSGPTTNGYFVQDGPLPFASDYARTPGGTTLHWLGTCLRMLPNDFRLKTAYGVADDWPISYDDLKPYYEMAEFEIGVSANRDELEYPNTGKDFFGEDYQFPMKGIPTSYLDQQFGKKVDSKEIEISDGKGGKTQVTAKVTPTPQGRNSIPNPDYRRKSIHFDECEKKLVWKYLGNEEFYEPAGATWDPFTGQRCEGNASCVPICPVQAKYNALKTLKVARNSQRGSLTIVPKAVAYKVEVRGAASDANSPVTAIRYKKYKNANEAAAEDCRAVGRRYVLAAHAVENAKLLLASQIANGSDQVGRNLMDHVTLLTWGRMNDPIYPYRGPGSTSNLAVFRDGEFRREHSAFIMPIDNWGWAWPVFSPGTDLTDRLNKNIFGKKLRRELHEDLTRQVLLHAECEQLPEPSNRVTISDSYKDILGIHRPIVRYDVSNYVRKGFVAGKNVSDQLFKEAGVEDRTNFEDASVGNSFEYEGKKYVYQGAGHLVGTHRMGMNPRDSVINWEQRTWEHNNLFLVGSGSMTTLGTSNPTLTMAALTFWAAETILKDLRGGDE